MNTLRDSRNELLDYLQENEVSLKIIKKISKELEKQDKQFIKDIEEIIVDRGRRAFPEIKRLSGFEE